MPSSPTKRGTQKLSDVALKVVAPTGIVASSWPAVEFTCTQRLGVEFDDWQIGAGRLILARRADGRLAAMVGGVGMSLPRQVGKTYLIGSMAFALCINQPGMLVIWSAHHARTHGETFLSMQEFAKRSKVSPYVERVYTGSGDEEIRFHNGSRILFGARERGFGRGVPGVDMIVADEAQIMSDKALDAQLATMNTSQFGLAIFVGTPPRPDDPSEAFTRMRTEAWEGTLRDAAWIEFGVTADADPTDRAQWRMANPSYPRRTPAESILRLQRKLKPESFLREGLGVWTTLDGSQPIPLSQWTALADPEGASLELSDLTLAVDMPPDRSSAAVVACGRRPDGTPQVEVVEVNTGSGWVVDRCSSVAMKRWVREVVIDGASAAAALIPALEAAGLTVRKTTTRDYTDACGGLFDAVVGSEVRNVPHPAMAQALAGASKRPLGDAWAFDKRKASADITPLVAAALARWGVTRTGDSAPVVLMV